jgi:uncharacterized repeat protein (TIGR04076 family)
MTNLKIEVIKILEKGKLCSATWHSLYPYLNGLRFGANYPWEEDPNSVTVCCPDYKNPVVFKITRDE